MTIFERRVKSLSARENFTTYATPLIAGFNASNTTLCGLCQHKKWKHIKNIPALRGLYLDDFKKRRHNLSMTIQEIKEELVRRGWTQADLAEKLAYNAKSLYEVLRGARPMTETLLRHIELLFAEPNEVLLVYKVDISNGQTEKLRNENDELNESARTVAVEAVLHHNLNELIELGKSCKWNERERKFLGLGHKSEQEMKFTLIDKKNDKPM